MKKSFFTLLCSTVLVLTAALLWAPTSFAVSNSEATQAYYDFLMKIDDGTPLKLNGNKVHGIAFGDMTGDGIDEMVIYSTPPGASGISSIYSYGTGSLQLMAEGVYGATGAPYFCRSGNGRCYLSTSDLSYGGDGAFIYGFVSGEIKRVNFLTHTFIPEWRYGSIESSYGRTSYTYTDIGVGDFWKTLEYYHKYGVEDLKNCDYRAVMEQVKAKLPASFFMPSDWAAEVVQQAADAGILPKHLTRRFNLPITRGEFCELADAYYEKLSGVPEITVTFSDTKDLPAVNKMASLGVVNGVGGDRFDPYKGLTRQEAATILSRLAKVMDKTMTDGECTYADNDKIADWAKTQVGQMTASGIMNGVGNNRFDPLAAYSREQSIATLVRMGFDFTGEPEEVTLNKTNAKLFTDGTLQLYVPYQGGKMSNERLTWTSSNDSIASVSSTGLVTAKSGGTATITATEVGGDRASCKVSVTQLDGHVYIDCPTTVTCYALPDGENGKRVENVVTLETVEFREYDWLYDSWSFSLLFHVIEDNREDMLNDADANVCFDYDIYDTSGNLVKSLRGENDLGWTKSSWWSFDPSLSDSKILPNKYVVVFP